jgi:hypothetical protein
VRQKRPRPREERSGGPWPVERKGVEPSTSALRTHEPQNASEADKGLASSDSSACTNACTSTPGNATDDTDEPLETTGTECGSTDSDLVEVIRRWPALPAAIKAGIVAMVKAAGTR